MRSLVGAIDRDGDGLAAGRGGSELSTGVIGEAGPGLLWPGRRAVELAIPGLKVVAAVGVEDEPVLADGRIPARNGRSCRPDRSLPARRSQAA